MPGSKRPADDEVLRLRLEETIDLLHDVTRQYEHEAKLNAVLRGEIVSDVKQLRSITDVLDDLMRGKEGSLIQRLSVVESNVEHLNDALKQMKTEHEQRLSQSGNYTTQWIIAIVTILGGIAAGALSGILSK